MTSIVIQVPLFRSITVLHQGSSANYERFVGSYFVKKQVDEPNTIVASPCDSVNHCNTQHTIIYAAYQPDYSYMDSDGVYGRCWVVCVNNTETGEWTTYTIRNWIDLVKYYESFDYAFVQM